MLPTTPYRIKQEKRARIELANPKDLDLNQAHLTALLPLPSQNHLDDKTPVEGLNLKSRGEREIGGVLLTLWVFTRAPCFGLNTKVAQGLLQPSTQTIRETKESSVFCLLCFQPQPIQPYLTPRTTKPPLRLPQRLPNTRGPVVDEEILKALSKRHPFQSTIANGAFFLRLLLIEKQENIRPQLHGQSFEFLMGLNHQKNLEREGRGFSKES